jgi:hypothetical protein
MIILDTNVMSALMRDPADEKATVWLDRQPATSVWITSITVLELQYGLQILSPGKKRSELTQVFEVLLTEKLGHRIASFDADAAHRSAELMAARRKKGTPVELRDTMIAGIALASNAILATRNVTHFDDLSISVVNPWTLLS